MKFKVVAERRKKLISYNSENLNSIEGEDFTGNQSYLFWSFLLKLFKFFCSRMSVSRRHPCPFHTLLILALASCQYFEALARHVDIKNDWRSAKVMKSK